jgi:hypothetical protein
MQPEFEYRQVLVLPATADILINYAVNQLFCDKSLNCLIIRVCF